MKPRGRNTPRPNFKKHLSETRAKMMDILKVNPVVKGKVEKECERVLALRSKLPHGWNGKVAALDILDAERVILKNKTIALQRPGGRLSRLVGNDAGTGRRVEASTRRIRCQGARLQSPRGTAHTSSGFQASLRYEAVHLVTSDTSTTADALRQLIRLLQEQGYTNLRSQQSYPRRCLPGLQEPWIEYPDRQPEPEVGLLGLDQKMAGAFAG